MARKKIVIYALTFLIFMSMLTIYTAFVIQTTREDNELSIKENIAISENQIEKNVEYQSKDLLYDLNRCNLKESNSLSDMQNQIAPVTDKDLYIADDGGMLYKEGGLYDGRKVDTSVLKTASSRGYSAVSVTDMEDGSVSVGLVLPISDNSSYYLVQMLKAETFLDIVLKDIQLPAEYYILFDEWGNAVSESQSGETSEISASYKDSLLSGASAFSYRQSDGNIKQNGFTKSYSVYLKIAQPDSWFLGTQVTYHDTNHMLFGMPAQSIIIFILLVVIIAVVITLDVINDREKKKELFLVSSIDSLTGLTNSAGLQEAVQSFMQKYPVSGYDFICMDIVAFNRINAMFGHSIGDMLLRIISAVIKDRYFCGARINADCFTFFAKHSEDMIQIIEGSFYSAIGQQLGAEYNQMIAFKFGIYPITESRPPFHEIYDGAMLALKDAKKQPRQSKVIYDNELKSSKELQKNIEINMIHALSKEEFVVYVQPQFEMPGEECLRGETLIRWQSEFMGFLPPDKFIPIFEGNGFIVETDFFMLTAALDLLSNHLRLGKKPITLAVNQSKVTISFPNYYERLKNLIEKYDVPLQYIELEITESTMEDDWGVIVPLIHSIKKLGFSIAMDDFGSGFSSLNTLRILPIDIIKIDKGFLEESTTSERSKIIVRSIINMAKELNIKVVCEGVETKEQLEFVREVNCDIVQGYHYSKPVPLQYFLEKYIGYTEEELEKGSCM